MMHPSPTIRAAQAADAHRLAVLSTQVWLHTYATDGISHDIANYTLAQLTPDKYLSVLGDSSSHVWVAEYRGNLIGLAIIQFGVSCPASSRSSTELQTLYVQEHFVGQGVGRLLLRAAEEETRRRAQTVLWLTVNARNANALAFYQHQGYTQIGTSYFALGDTQHANHVLLGPDV